MDLVPSVEIKVSALWKNKVFEDARQWSPTHIISMLNPGLTPPDFSKLGSVEHMSFALQDIGLAEHKYSDEQTLFRIKAFVDDICVPGFEKPRRLLVHCHLGVSRSTAIALYAIARCLDVGNEKCAFRYLQKITNKPWPNRALVTFFDKSGGHNGKLLEELDSYRLQHPFRYSAYKKLNKKLGRC